MKSTIISVSCLLMGLFLTHPLLAQSGEIGRIEILLDVDDGIRINIYDISISGMQNKEAHVGFMLAQDGQWLDDSWIPLESFIVAYDPAY